MTSIANLGDKLGDMQTELVNRAVSIEAIKIDLATQHNFALKAMNDAFDQFNACLDHQLAAIKELIGG